MKLLITTQAVDAEDSVLGFFHRWIEEFAKHCERVTVLCLREGKHTFPKNVEIIQLHSQTRIMRAIEFIRLVVMLRNTYSAVFVHMNPEYTVLGGLLWRLWGKKIGLWYVHKAVTLRLRLATILCHIVFTASKESFRLHSSKVHVVGHGIDTVFFSPDPSVARATTLLSVGRLMRSKRHDLAIRVAADEGKVLHVVGEGPERQKLEELARELGVRVRFLGGLNQAQLRDEYRTAARLIHRSETGSLDKVVLEAAACGLPVDTLDPALAALPLKRPDPDYVRAHHSLDKLVSTIMDAYH